MIPLHAIELSEPRLHDFCCRWQVSELALFGSVLRDDFGSDNDVDFLVSFSPEARPGLMALAQMHQELQDLVGRDVDLVSKRALERSHNWIRKQNILNSAETIYSLRRDLSVSESGSSCLGSWWMRQVAPGALAKPAEGVTHDIPLLSL